MKASEVWQIIEKYFPDDKIIIDFSNFKSNIDYGFFVHKEYFDEYHPKIEQYLGWQLKKDHQKLKNNKEKLIETWIGAYNLEISYFYLGKGLMFSKEIDKYL